MSVSMKPGATTLARMPYWPTSFARALVKPMMPAFDAE